MERDLSKTVVYTYLLIILRNFNYWPKFLVSYKNTCKWEGLIRGGLIRGGLNREGA